MSTSAFDDAVFILGCQRSGTTLLRLVLDAHPAFACYDESRAYRILAGAEPFARDARRPVFKIPRFTEQIDAPMWQDYGELSAPARYTGQPLLFLVRDPVDVVHSMLTLGDGGWYDAWIEPILDARAARDAAFAPRWQRARRDAADCADPRAAVGAWYWVYKTEALLRYRESGLPVSAIRYESLVTEPATVLAPLIAQLGEAWVPALLAHQEVAHGEVGDDGRTVGETDPRRSIDDTSIGLGRRSFGSETLEIIERITAPLRRSLALS